MWEITYDAPVGLRFNKDVFHGFTCYIKDGTCGDMWFESKSRTFKKHYECTGSMSSHGHGVNSVRAFKKYLKNKCEHMKDFEIVLCSRIFIDIDGKEISTNVTARWV